MTIIGKIGYLTLFAALAIAGQSCESIIEFKGEITEPKVVLYSILQPDSLITVNITKSYAITDYKYEPSQITDAAVRLYCDGDFVELLTYIAPPVQPEYEPPVALSKYMSQSITPIFGSVYRIEVEVAGFKTVIGETSLPEIVPVVSIDTSMYEQDELWRNMITKVRLVDPVDNDNFYMLQIMKKWGAYAGNPYEPYHPESSVRVHEGESYLDNNDEPLLSPDRGEDQFGMYIYNSFNIFSDELISGKQYDLKIKVDYSMPDTNYYEFIHFQVQLQSITKDLYLYLQSYSAHMQTRDQFFSEPVVVYTNVKNGLGIVGAKVTSTGTVKIGRYPVDGVNYIFDDY